MSFFFNRISNKLEIILMDSNQSVAVMDLVFALILFISPRKEAAEVGWQPCFCVVARDTGSTANLSRWVTASKWTSLHLRHLHHLPPYNPVTRRRRGLPLSCCWTSTPSGIIWLLLQDETTDQVSSTDHLSDVQLQFGTKEDLTLPQRQEYKPVSVPPWLSALGFSGQKYPQHIYRQAVGY